jgi:hypothetical protein
LFSFEKKEIAVFFIFLELVQSVIIKLSKKIIMQILGKLLLSIVIVCYISTAYGKQKTVTDTVVEGATHLKDNVVEGATHLKDNVVDGAKVAADAAKTAG